VAAALIRSEEEMMDYKDKTDFVPDSWEALEKRMKANLTAEEIERVDTMAEKLKKALDTFNKAIAEITGNEDVDPNTIT
jgi:hypothetical protein